MLGVMLWLMFGGAGGTTGVFGWGTDDGPASVDGPAVVGNAIPSLCFADMIRQGLVSIWAAGEIDRGWKFITRSSQDHASMTKLSVGYHDQGPHSNVCTLQWDPAKTNNEAPKTVQE